MKKDLGRCTVEGGWMQHDALTSGLIEQHGQIYRVIPAEVK